MNNKLPSLSIAIFSTLISYPKAKSCSSTRALQIAIVLLLDSLNKFHWSLICQWKYLYHFLVDQRISCHQGHSKSSLSQVELIIIFMVNIPCLLMTTATSAPPKAIVVYYLQYTYWSWPSAPMATPNYHIHVVTLHCFVLLASFTCCCMLHRAVAIKYL